MITQLPEIRQLRVFITLEETRSFTAAANILHITQSAVSHSLKSLEQLLECQLIERLGKKCILTPHGEVFLHHAKKAMRELEGATAKIGTLNDWGYSSLKVGASNTLCQYELDDGELDIAFGVYSKALSLEHPFVKLGEDKLCFITAPSHPWCDKKPENTEDFTQERFIVYGNDTITNQILKTHLPGIGIKQRATLAMGNMESIKEMVALNLGVGIISDWIAKRELEKDTLVKHEITPAPVREWGYYMNRVKTRSLPEEEFLKIFFDQLDKVLS